MGSHQLLPARIRSHGINEEGTTMNRLDERLAMEGEPLGDDETTALAVLRQRAKHEAGCPTCRGYGWRAKPGLPEAGNGHAAQVLVCGCDAGKRFWALALANTATVLALMDLDADGHIASDDGMYGRFGINDRRLLLATARAKPANEPAAQAPALV